MDFEAFAAGFVLEKDILVRGVSHRPAVGDFVTLESPEHLEPNDLRGWFPSAGIALLLRDGVEFPSFGGKSTRDDRQSLRELDVGSTGGVRGNDDVTGDFGILASRFP